MSHRLPVRTGPMFAIIRVLVTLAALGAALVDGHKWS